MRKEHHTIRKWKIPPVPEPIRLKELLNLACTSTMKSVKWVTEIKFMFWTKRKSEGGTSLVSLWQKIKYMTISLRYSLKWTELEKYHLISLWCPWGITVHKNVFDIQLYDEDNGGHHGSVTSVSEDTHKITCGF